MRSYVAVLAALLIAAPAANAQFVTPVPKTQNADLARTGFVRRAINLDVLKAVADCKTPPKESAAPATDTDPLSADSAASLVRGCVRTKVVDLGIAECKRQMRGRVLENPGNFLDNCKLDSATVEWIAAEETALPRNYHSPIIGGRAWMVEMMESSIGLDVLSRFGANMSDDEIFVVADMISGAVGVMPFAVSAASMVVKAKEGEPQEPQEEITGLRADLTKLINNGGTVAARLQAPLYYKTGTTVRSGASVYTQVGYLGDTSKPSGVGTLVLEMMNAFTIRRPVGDAAHTADLLVGIRGGHSWKDSDFADVTDLDKFGFAQFAFGLMRDNGEMAAQVLLTYSSNRTVRDNIPKVLFNLSAMR